MKPSRAITTVSLLIALALGGACSAEGDVDSGGDGDGVEIKGDVDGKDE